MNIDKLAIFELVEKLDDLENQSRFIVKQDSVIDFKTMKCFWNINANKCDETDIRKIIRENYNWYHIPSFHPSYKIPWNENGTGYDPEELTRTYNRYYAKK